MADTTVWRRLASVIAIVAVTLAVVVVLRGSDGNDPACGDKTFDPQSWRAAESREAYPGRASDRLEIAEELERCRTLVGRTRVEVRTMLGRPEYPPQAVDEGPCYDLGTQPELGGLDNRVLCLSYDDSGRVTRAAVATS
jgi:hypothetical protein